MATLFKTDGTVQEIVPAYDLASLQKLVDGLIEFVYFEDGSAVMVNEEGRLLGLRTNSAATAMCFLKRYPLSAPLSGDAVFFSASEMKAMKEMDD